MPKKPDDPSAESGVPVSVPEETLETDGVPVQVPIDEPASSDDGSSTGQKAATQKKEG